jgi:uncharacterized protein (DUF952 family)
MQLTMAAHEEERHWKQRNETRVEPTSLFRNFPFGAFRGQLHFPHIYKPSQHIPE